MKEKALNVLALFTSASTLFCCALPAALAAIAGGAAVGTLISVMPWIVVLSRYKVWLFVAGAVLITASGILTLRPQGKLACAITGGRGCETANRFQKVSFWTALAVYVFSCFFAYGLVPLLRVLGI